LVEATLVKVLEAKARVLLVRVSVLVGVTTPVNVLFVAAIVLPVSVCVPVRLTKVSVPVGIVTVPLFEILEITGDVRVLFVSVSVVARPTKVSVDVGRVRVPVFVIVDITGADEKVLTAEKV
jgi:hypothetical protein